jgi:ElaB/YqjD/DUF883 family membrane-anchored ribosome-binding protein
MQTEAINSNKANASANKESIDTSTKGSNEFHKFLADIEDIVKSTTSLSGDDLAKVKADLNERIVAAKATLTDVSENLTSQAKNAADVSNNYVHEKPWQVIGMSGAIGLLLGYVIARRS